MTMLDDAVDALTSEAGRTDPVARIVARAKVLQTIGDINHQIALGCLRSAKTISVASGTSIYLLPADFGSMSAIGKYDSGTDRITELWRNVGDYRFIKAYEYGDASSVSGTPRLWMMLPQSSNQLERIRIIPTPDTSFTAQMIYFARLDQNNIERMGWLQPLVNGAKRMLPGWFPESGYIKAESDYREDIKKLSPVYNISPMSALQQDPTVRDANIQMRMV